MRPPGREPGRDTTGTPSSLFRYDVLEGRPTQQAEEHVVEREKGEIASRRADDACAYATDDDRDGKREEQEWEKEIARARGDRHCAEERPHRADADVGEDHAGHRRAAEPVEEEREQREGDELRRTEERERGDALREPDGAAVAGREHETVEHALLAFGNERASQTEQSSEENRHPQQAARRQLRRVGRQGEVKDDERRDDEEQHRRQGVARAELEQQILARQRAHVGEVRHASASRSVASRATRSGSWVETSTVRSPRSSAS